MIEKAFKSVDINGSGSVSKTVSKRNEDGTMMVIKSLSRPFEVFWALTSSLTSVSDSWSWIKPPFLFILKAALELQSSP